jgi:hypothetical protein
MSAIFRGLHFIICIKGVEHWTLEHREAAITDTIFPGYDDWALNKLNEVMKEAGQNFMHENPDLFTGEIT